MTSTSGSEVEIPSQPQQKATFNSPWEAQVFIGTTGRGIGPTYADKINRIGLRFGDLSEVIGDVDWAETVSQRMNSDLSAAGAEGRIEAWREAYANTPHGHAVLLPLGD